MNGEDFSRKADWLKSDHTANNIRAFFCNIIYHLSKQAQEKMLALIYCEICLASFFLMQKSDLKK